MTLEIKSVRVAPKLSVGLGRKPRPRASAAPVGDRPAEDGGAAVQLPLASLLPEEKDERGRFERLARELMQVGGVTRVHLRGDAGILECCVHHDGAREPEALKREARERGLAVAKRFRAKTWFVRGMDSAQCGAVIEHVLSRTRGVLTADVAYAAERVVVEFDSELVSEKQIEKLVRSVGYELEVPEPGHVCSHHAHSGSGLAPKLELPLVISAGVLIGVGLSIEKLVADVPPIAPTLIFAAALLCGGFFAARSAVLALIAKKVDIETLMVLAAIGAAILGAWFEGAFLLFLFSLGHMLEHRAMDRARRAVESLEKLRPETAHVKKGTDIVETKIEDVERGWRIVIRPGDRVPLDGVVVDGESQIDQASLTGESVPVPKRAGDPVFAGTVNVDGSLEVEVEKLASESTLAKLVDLVAEAESRKSKAQRFAKRVEQIFVPVVIIAAPVLVFALWGLGTPFRDAVLRGLSLLVAASPCALAVSTPAAVLSAVARAARGGVLIKGGAHLEALASLKIVALDKTGTLTEGAPKLVDIRPLSASAGAMSADALVALAASAEQLSAHPLALAIVDAAREKKLELAHAEDLRAVHGRGLEAKVAGKRVRIGNTAMFADGGGAGDEIQKIVAALEGEGRTTMIVEHDGAFVGVLGVMDTPRPAAAAAVQALRKAGVERTIMLSGDANAVARAVAKQVGVEEVRAPLMPEDKVKAVRELQREGNVAMVGDGVNDGPALAAAHVGVAMGGAGSDVALETADVVLMGDDLMRLSFAIRLARSATNAVRQNIIVALGVAIVLVIASIAGFVEVAQAVVFHEGSTVVVVLNGLRLLLFSAPKA